MKIEDIKGIWMVVPEDTLQKGCEIKCPECGEWHNHEEWKETEVPCDLCGEHLAMECPNCKERFDHVYSEVFECRIFHK